MPNINIKYAMNLVGIANHMLASEGADFYFKRVHVSEAATDANDTAPTNDFVVGDSVKIINVKDNVPEVLSGQVIAINCRDDNGWYNRVQCGDRKFKVPVVNGEQRLGTMVTREV